ncbi:MAG TPA: hypothetical protein GX534_04820 [Thermoanaerobacterales bacterium]|jgi:peptide/nickel transport system substrate-binding protein|nr:hypothetical protein [Thermoanaerobacterales bacterium]
MFKNRKLLSIIILVLTAAFLVTGCGGGGNSQSGKEDGNTLVIAIPEEIEGTDISQINWENIVHTLMYEPLVSFDLQLKEVLPAAASSYEILDGGKQIKFTIPEDACFANGDPLTAEDIKLALERHKEISPYAEDLEPVKEIVVEDPQTLIFKMDSPAAFLWPVLTSVYSGIADAKKAEELGKEAFNRQAVGNGPYLVEEWVQGSHITLVKNPKYKTNNPVVENKGAAKIDKIIVRFIPENFTRISELKSGNTDIVVNVPIETLEELKKNQDIELYEYMQTGVDYLSINTEVEPLNDVRVRKAIAMAIDKDELNQVLKGTVVPRYGLLSQAQLCYDEKAEEEFKKQYGYNVEKAKQLLEEAGYKANSEGIMEKDGKPLSITLMVALDSPFMKQAAPIMQAQLQKAGINLELREYEIKYIKQMMYDHTYEMATRYYWWSDPDILYYIFHSEAGYPWSNPEVDKLIEEARYIMDMDERTAKYNEIQSKILDEMPGIPLFSEYQYLAARKNVKGLQVGVDGKVYINDVTKE